MNCHMLHELYDMLHVNYILCKLLKNYSLHKNKNTKEVSPGEARNKIERKKAGRSSDIPKTLLLCHNMN